MRRLKRRTGVVRASLLGGVALMATALLLRGHTQQPARAQSSGDMEMRAVMLGTGTPNADPERSGPSVAIVRGQSAYIVDAGPGVVRRASAAARAGTDALRMPRLHIVFLTHLHSDHTLGLPDLIFSPWVLGRKDPLEVYGPPGTKAMVDHLLAAYVEDIRNRTEGLEHGNTTGYKVNVHEVTNGFVYRDSLMLVRAFEVPHGQWAHAFGYRFEAGNRAIVVSGDTRASDSVVTACHGCDILFHEVYSSSRFLNQTPAWQKYLLSAHTSTKELAALATAAQPKLLVLYHQLYEGAIDDSLLVREIRDGGFHGTVVSAKDLGVYR